MLDDSTKTLNKSNVKKSGAQTPSPFIEAKSSVPVLVAINDGGNRVTLDGRGNLRGLSDDDMPPAARQAIAAALATGQLDAPAAAIAELNGKTGTLRGEAASGKDGFALASPVGAIIKTARPQFRWQSLSGASAYVVNVYDSSFNKAATSGQLTSTEWTPTTALKSGEIYVWQVTAIKAGREIVAPAPPAPEAHFKVLDEKAAQELERLKRTSGKSHLALGVAYARAGLLFDAEQEFQALQRANPQSPAARKLLQQIRSLQYATRK